MSDNVVFIIASEDRVLVHNPTDLAGVGRRSINMDYVTLKRQVAKKLAAGMGFCPAFRAVMRENGIRTGWEEHAHQLGALLANRRRRKKTGGSAREDREAILAEIAREDQLQGAIAAAHERHDEYLRDP